MSHVIDPMEQFMRLTSMEEICNWVKTTRLDLVAEALFKYRNQQEAAEPQAMAEEPQAMVEESAMAMDEESYHGEQEQQQQHQEEQEEEEDDDELEGEQAQEQAQDNSQVVRRGPKRSRAEAFVLQTFLDEIRFMCQPDQQDGQQGEQLVQDQQQARNQLLIQEQRQRQPQDQRQARDQQQAQLEQVIKDFLNQTITAATTSFYRDGFRSLLAAGAHVHASLSVAGTLKKKVQAAIGSSARATQGHAVFNLIHEHGMHKLRHLRPANKTIVAKLTKHHRAIAQHLAQNAEERQWWSEEQPMSTFVTDNHDNTKRVELPTLEWLFLE